MSNPFLRRATEYIRDAGAFLAIVSPEPLTTFVANRQNKGVLFDVPVRVIGSPGSGKTMIASLVEFRILETILRDLSSESNRTLASALAASGFTDGQVPLVAAVRLPMESEYRDFWELPYDSSIKTRLVLSLIQARTILGLVRNLTANRNRKLSDIRFVPREDAEAQLEGIGGFETEAIVNRARAVERAIYSCGASLLPIELDKIPSEAREPYQPFEAIRHIEIRWNDQTIALRPLIILDDVHTLHPAQFNGLFQALARREIRFGRWMMMRMDALSPSVIFRSTKDDALPGLKRDRDFIDIFMQSQSGRASERRQFRKMAADMADRYLRLVQPLRDRNFTQFGRLLIEEPPTLPEGKMRELREYIMREGRSLKISPLRQDQIEKIVKRYVSGAKSYDVGEDVQLVMTRVLMHRHAIRIAAQTPSLFEDDDPDLKQALTAKSSVADAGRIFLYQRFNRPLHYGFEQLCDASNENAEVFLQLAGALVERMETKAIRNQDPALTPVQQQAALRDKAADTTKAWSFPFANKISALSRWIAEECLQESQLANAPLGAGANAIGIPEEEMEGLLGSDQELSSILKFAIAYGVLFAVRDYGQGGKSWCLLELSGTLCLLYGLTLKRGGFLEKRIEDLAKNVGSQ